jgi:hypothetical protein
LLLGDVGPLVIDVVGPAGQHHRDQYRGHRDAEQVRELCRLGAC